jgi:glycosyltransferase involved in cell wall biosynthesis
MAVHRVLYVHHSSSMGGAPLSLLYLIKELDSKRYAPIVLFNTYPGPAQELFQQHNIPVMSDPRIAIYQHGQGTWLSLRHPRPWRILTWALRIWPSARRFKQMLENSDYDIIHLNSMVQVPAAIGARWSGRPVIWHIREELHPGYLGIRRMLVRRCIDCCADATIVISQQNASKLKQNGRIHIIYNFVDFDHFDRTLSGQAIRDELAIAPDTPIVTMLGGILSHKGGDIFVAAAVEVLKEHPEALFLVAGIPPMGKAGESPSAIKRGIRRVLENFGLLHNAEREALRLIAEHGLEDRVRFIGMRQDVPQLLAASTVLVWPATVSHFARPIMEAGAMARPVVASDFPSSREIVNGGETGLLAPAHDAKAFAQAIVHLLDNSDKARQMGEHAYTLAKQRYDARTNAAATFAVYDQVLAQRKGI